MRKKKILLKLFNAAVLWLATIILIAAGILNTTKLLILIVLYLGIWPIRKIFIGSSEALAPNALLSLTYLFYGLGPLMLMDLANTVLINKYLMLITLGFVSMKCGFSVGDHSSRNIIATDRIMVDSFESKKIFFLTTCSFFTLSVISTLSQIIALGGFQRFIQLGYGGDRFLASNETLSVGGGLSWLLLSAILFWYCGIKFSSKTSLIAGVLLFICTSLVLLQIGGRSTMAYSIMFATTLYHYGHKKIAGPIVGIGIVLGIILAQFYSLARYYLPDGLVSAFFETYRNVLDNPVILAPFASNEFTAPATSLIEVLQYGGTDLQFGSSYILAIGQFIPVFTRLTSEFFLDPSYWRLITYHPDVLIEGGGLGYSPVTEGFINFGFIGIAVHLFLFGFVISRIHYRLISERTFSYLLLYAGSLPLFMLDGMRIHSSSFVYKWTRIYLAAWFLFCLFKYMQKNKYKRPIEKVMK